MSGLVRPFRALRPRARYAADVIAPPYDVVDTEEARALVAERPWSFLRVSRPEVEFPPGTDPYSDPVYQRAGANLARMISDNILVRDARPGYYLYRLVMGDHAQVGIGMTASIRAYEDGIIKRHELTRPTKETDRVRNIDALNAQTGPVLLAYKNDPRLDSSLASLSARASDVEVEGQHAVLHELWHIDEPDQVDELTRMLCALDALYIADGHHRSAAAARVSESRRGAAPSSSDYFLAVAFSDEQLEIHDYNRVVTDLNGLDESAFLERIRERFSVDLLDAGSKPNQPATFSMYLAGKWYRLAMLEPDTDSDPVERLDIRRLQRELLEPVLDIGDPRTDPRIDFIGGVRGLQALSDRVDAGEAAVAFALFPTSMHQLMAVADAGRLMPPKSTWFEPKLADGLLTHVLD